MGFSPNILHVPVMAREVLQMLDLKFGDCVVDCTMGLGGHSMEMVQAIGPKGLLVGIDRDQDSLDLAKQRLEEFSGRCAFVKRDFRFLDSVLEELGINEVDAVLFDLGVSSYQLDTPERGFSFKTNGPLDMRMDRSSYISAYDLINSLSSHEISAILKNFGEERFHRKIAESLIKQRLKHPIESTEQLKDLILKSVPASYRRERIHPATRAFQAFRIAVNRELEALDMALDKAVSCLKNNGCLCVISFHSLEDRIVKRKFKQFCKKGVVTLLTKKPLRCDPEEMEKNNRSRSARLRAIKKN